MNVFVKAAALAAIALGAMANDELPPIKYQRNAIPSVIVIVSDTDHQTPCGPAGPGYTTLGCEIDNKGVPVIFTGNPCLFPEAAVKGTYAHIMCHEFGHVNGWTHKD